MSEDKSTALQHTSDGSLSGKDPETGQFVAGNTLSPGRKEGSRNFATIYRAALQKVAEANDQTLDDVEDDLVKVAIDRARKGDFKFYQDLMDRLNGKAVVRTENMNLNADAHKLQQEEKDRLNDLLK